MKDRAIKVLLVEDNPGDARLVRETLSESVSPAFQLTHAEALSDAMRYLEKEQFDAVLLDLMLEDSSRLGTLMQIHEQASKVPVVVLTGLEDDVVGLWVLSEGAEDYLIKGNISGGVLASTICNAIERHSGASAIHSA
jgi:DNA-binding response OmpR family regulator